MRIAVAAALAAALIALAVFARPEQSDALKDELQAALSSAETSHGRADPGAYLRMLREHLEREPRDARAWVIYARLQAEMERFADAAHAYEKGLALSAKVARDPALWCEYADALGMARGGRLEGKPRELIDRALALDSRHPKALEMAGSAEYELGRYERALDYWRPLQALLAPGSRPQVELAAAIERTERLAAARL
jgi:cytochrome c-type biogenesis protein CcmH